MLSKESDEALGLANHGVNRRVAGLRVTWTFRRSAHDGVAPKTDGAKSVPNNSGLWRLGLAFEKQIPQFVENVSSKRRMERMEWLGMLAKQVLSPLSYTPPTPI